jgi:ribonuclease HI
MIGKCGDGGGKRKRNERRQVAEKNQTHKERHKINEVSSGKISEYPKGPTMFLPDFTNFTIISWNTNGIRPRSNCDKIHFISKITTGWKPDFILLQETHLDKETEYFLGKTLPNYYWVTNNFTSTSRGVAIGIKRSKHVPFPIEENYQDKSGKWIIQPIMFKGSHILIISVYKPDKQGKEVWNKITQKIKELGKGYGVILGGDFNAKPKSKEMTEIMEELASCHLSPVLSDAPTHGNGSQIDYIFYHDKFTTEVEPFLNVIPHSTDHGVVVSGIHRIRERPHLPNQRTPIELCDNPQFINRVFKIIGEYHPKECPFEYLGKLKGNVQQEAKSWRGKNDHYRKEDKEKYIMLWKLVSYCHRIKQFGNFPRKWMEFATIQDVIKEGKRRFKGKPRSTATCLEIIRRIKIISKELHVDVPQFKIYNTKRYTNKAKLNWKPHYKAVIVNDQGLPAENREQEQEILANFWTKILGTARPWKEDIMTTLLDEIGMIEDNISCQFTETEIKKYIKKRRNSAPGPDGIPMNFYANSIRYSHIMKLWIRILNHMALGKPTPSWLVEGNLILLPKQDGKIGPDKFRPITVSNSDYRLMMGLWARRLTKALDGWISKPQKALLTGRNIRECVANILDPWFQSKQEGKLIYLLQTDFAKAFDYVNRDAIKYILQKVKMNLGLSNALKVALNPAPTYLCIPKTSPILFTVNTGVKQGCPASPLMFIMIEDILIKQLRKVKEILAIEAYADDIGILINEKLEGVEEIGEKITNYCQATGAQLNMSKCMFLASRKKENVYPIPKCWENAQRPVTTTYLGIFIGQELLEKDRWENPERSAKIIATKMHEMKAPLRQKCFQINTYMIPLYNYIQRHYLMPRSVANNLSKNIRYALGTHNYIPDRVLYATKEPLKLSRPIIHPFFLGTTMLALSPSVPEIKSGKAISSKTIYWHQMVAREIIDKKLGMKISQLIYSAPYTNKCRNDKKKKSMRATLTRTLTGEGMWKLIDQIEGSIRAVFAANFFKLKQPRLKMIMMTLLNKGWSLKHQFAMRKEGEDMICSMCKKENETYKHILEKCESAKELIRIWKKKWDTSQPICHERIRWPEMGSDLLCAKEVLNEKETKIRCLLINLLHDTVTGCRKNEVNMHQMNEEIRKIKWITMKKSKKWSGKKSGKDNAELGLNQESRINEEDTMVTPILKQWEEIEESKRSQYTGFFDGSGRSNPQTAGGGWVLYLNHKEIEAGAIHMPYQTSNDGESMACAELLEHINKLNLTKVNIFGDSKLIIDHLEKKKLISKHEWADCLISFQLRKWRKGITYSHIPRELNKRADAIANAAAISQEEGNKMAKLLNKITRVEVEEKEEKPMKCKKMKDFIDDTKKKMISFPIGEDFKIPIIGASQSEVGVVEDFRETKYTGYKTISVQRIDTIFKKVA